MKSIGWKNIRRRFCCAVLAITMVMCEVPMTVYALDEDKSKVTENEVINQQLQEEDNLDIALENNSDKDDANIVLCEKETVCEEKSEVIIESEEAVLEAVSEENDKEMVTEDKATVATRGTFGDVEWYVELNEDNMATRTLTIKPIDGLTEVTIYDDYYHDYPWSIFYESVTKVILEDGIKNVPAYAFSAFSILREVEMADSIEVIGRAAFRFCDRLGFGKSENEIHWPAGLKVIRNHAFQGCGYMDEYVLPPHLETIEEGAFERNDGLNRIFIPASVSHIDEDFYTSTGYLSRQNFKVEVDSANPYYSVTDGILYEDATGTALLCGAQTSKLIKVRPGTKRIGKEAFMNMSVRDSITFDFEMPDSVITIGDGAFAGSRIENIKLSENLRTIGKEAFSVTPYLYTIDFPDSVTSIGEDAFSYCSIRKHTFPKSMTVIPKNMYSDAKRFLNRPLYIPAGIVEIEDGAFYNAKIDAVSIPKSVRKIGDFAFDENHILDIYYGGTEEEWRELLNSHVSIGWTINATVHYYTDKVDLTFKDGVFTSEGQLKSGLKFEEIGVNDNTAVKDIKFSDWVNKYGLSMRADDMVEQNNEYFAYVSILTDSFFNEATKVTINGEECEIFDIAADGSRLSFVTPTFISNCMHSRADMSTYDTDGERHWHGCPDCGKKVREGAHTFDNGTIVAGVTTYKCTVCSYEKVTSNGRMRMNKTQISGGYYEVGDAIPKIFLLDENFAYVTKYDLYTPVWYKGAYSESNKINVNDESRFENDKYYVEFNIAIKKEFADQYYLKDGGITVRFVRNGLKEEISYRVVTDDPDVPGRQIQKVVFSYTPIARGELTVVLPTFVTGMTVSQLKQNIKYTSGGQNIEPMYPPTVLDKDGNSLSDTDLIFQYKSYAIQPMLDVPGYIDENSIKGKGITGCRPGGLFNYRAEDDKTGVFAPIEFYFSPKAITVANVDMDAPLDGEKLGENVFAREFNLFGITSVNWFIGEGTAVSSDHIAQLGNNYGIIVRLAPKDQYVFSRSTIFTINGYEPSESLFYNEGSAMLVYKFPTVEEHIHIPVLVPMDPGNCTAKGHVAYYQCNDCGRCYLDRELTQRIVDINTWLNTPNNGLLGGMIQDTSIHDFIFDQENNSPVDVCQDCGIKNINYRELKVHVADIHYTGSVLDAPITIEGLTSGFDYYISEGANATLPGVYKAVIKGRNSYGGQREVEWTISTDGMWISFDVINADFDYTGAQIKPSVKVYDGDRRLTLGKDYTISYKNNTNSYTLKAGDSGFDANKAPTVIVTGKGDYSGKETANFVISPKSLDGVNVADMYVNATGKPIAVKPVVKIGNKTLVLNKDYGIYNALNLSEKVGSVTASNTYKLAVRGIGNYKGGSEFNFEVTEKKLINKCSITVKNAEYDNGRIVRPEVIAKYQGKTLTIGTDYELELSDREVGNATVKIIGKGTYSGTVTKSFKITGVAISSVKAEPIADYEYSGNEPIPAPKLTYEKRGATPETLKIHKDYEVKYVDNKNVGKAKIVITGKGKYTGTKTVIFKIIPMDVNKDVNRISINGNSSINEAYLAGGVKPDVPVTFNGSTLKKGVDYTCTYSNNTSVGLENYAKAPTITYTFKGNFKGKIVKTFNIRNMHISNLDVLIPHVVYSTKANSWISKPVIKDANGKPLKDGRDYKVSYYTNSTLTTLASESSNVLNNVIYVKIEGIEPYMGEIHQFYRILKGNIANAQVKIDDIEYDPEGLTTVKKSNIKINCGGVDLNDSDYYIVEISMPQGKLGTGTVLLRSAGDYGGYFGDKRAKFKVVPRNTSDTNKNKVYIIGDASSIYYKKSGSKLGFRVMYVDSYGLNSKWIQKGVDYTISYANTGKAAKASDAKAPTIIVKFKGRFKGKQELKYEITKQPLGYGDIYNSDVVYNSKPDGWKQTKFIFKDIEKNVLRSGVDYELMPGYYSDSGCTIPFTDADNIVGKDVYFKLAAKPNSNYQGEWIGSYKIVKGDISKASVTIKNTKNWTGTNVDLLPSDIKVSINGTTINAGSDWEIVACRNNIKRGTATVEIRGIGNYGGTKTATFKIIQKPLRWWNR